MNSSIVSYKNHRFPPQIIARAVWLYFRFPLSLRPVEVMLLERGIIVSHETTRRWGRKFGPAYAKQLRRKKPTRKDVWHLEGLTLERIITDKLRSYGAAKREVMPSVEHRSHKGLNNRAENSHLPLRKRERVMQGLRSAGGLQRFISVFSAVRNLFVPQSQKRSALCTQIHRMRAMAQWKAITGTAA